MFKKWCIVHDNIIGTSINRSVVFESNDFKEAVLKFVDMTNKAEENSFFRLKSDENVMECLNKYMRKAA